MIDHGIHVSGTNGKEKSGLTEFPPRLTGMPVRLTKHSDFEAGVFQASGQYCHGETWVVDIGILDARQPLLGIAETFKLQATPIHEMKEQAAHTAIGGIQVIEHSPAFKFASRTTKQDDGQLLRVMVAMQHA